MADGRAAPRPAAHPPALTGDALVAVMTSGKKRDASGSRVVVMDGVGAPRLARGVPGALVRDAWTFAR